SLAQSPCRIDHVIHDDAVAALDVTDDVHDFGHVGTRPTLVDDGQVHFQTLGQRARAHHAADIGRHHHEVIHVALPDIAQQYRCGIDVVDGNIEETLDLVGMQVQGQDAVYTGDLQHIRHHFGRNRDARRTGATILTGITEIGDGCRDATGRGTTQGIDHHHDFHQVVIGGSTC